ncbi:MAG TPA: HAD-IIA family hydrolase [Clostridia bacterium]|jgi:4-nitrophenyl phosphatase|nr:HAD-IIA family hydrolase [Clostridiaceae bacterium]HOM34440.1 HAD-IIA family hydrolase [Clostridia bacterium]HOT70594.1 HAD-IIA family hydrolase [Clostridia bacterium]HQG00650.1 HAD-IIA family hydrolase [Clostridia bacterium]HQH65132.1 HAD-IIA family hydrolase [Clostridia bacterium]
MALKDIKCFVLDMDGTIYLGNQLFDYTKEFLATAEQCGIDIWYYTNNSSKNAKFYINKLKKMGIVCEERKMLISNQVIIKHLLEHHQKSRVYVAGTQYLIDDFEEAGINVTDTDCDVVVMGFDTTLTYEKLVKACDFVRYGATLYGVNMDYNCPTETGFIPDCGSICQLVYASTGVSAEFFGKPSKHTADFIFEKTGYDKKSLAIVGDRVYTDIALGAYNGFTSILVLSGESSLEDVKNSDAKPDLIYASLKEISEDLKKIYKL